jgi:hypothetical protein
MSEKVSGFFLAQECLSGMAVGQKINLTPFPAIWADGSQTSPSAKVLRLSVSRPQKPR